MYRFGGGFGCDLACPHCFRQYIATPDKIMSLGWSYKVNWRRPLMNRNLPKIMINKKMGFGNYNQHKRNIAQRRLCQGIDFVGLDLLIYSFDGGSKQAYDKLK